MMHPSPMGRESCGEREKPEEEEEAKEEEETGGADCELIAMKRRGHCYENRKWNDRAVQEENEGRLKGKKMGR